jgi:hypothetical protein
MGVFPILIPAELPIIEGEAANMPAMKANELAKGADAGVVESRSVCVVSNALADRFERGLPEQTIDQRCRRSMIEHEPSSRVNATPNWRRSLRSPGRSLNGGTTVTES